MAALTPSQRDLFPECKMYVKQRPKLTITKEVTITK